jgi:hypothetical protein
MHKNGAYEKMAMALMFKHNLRLKRINDARWMRLHTGLLLRTGAPAHWMAPAR